jgi:nucleolar protein 53
VSGDTSVSLRCAVLKYAHPVRKRLPKFSSSALTSAKILAQRSAVPAVFSRTASSTKDTKGKRKLSHEEKTRLLRLGKRARRGPLNSFEDEAEFGKGSALLEVSDAARQAGAYDVWATDTGPMDADVPEEARVAAVKVYTPLMLPKLISHA